jgi:hypothetical protein
MGHINSKQHHVILNKFNNEIFIILLLHYHLYFMICGLVWLDSASNLVKNE